MYDFIIVILTLLALFYSISLIRIMYVISKKLHVESSMIPLTPEETTKELEQSFNDWKNIVSWEFDDFDRMTYIYGLVIKTSDGKHYKAYVYSDDGEQPLDDFKELEWFEVKFKEITIQAWIPK